MTILKDGKGRGYRAGVNAQNRLDTNSVTTDTEDNAIRTGDGWQITSGPITLTGSSASAILYVENTGEADFVLDRAVLLLGTATNAATGSDWTFQTLRNPTTGTIVTNAVAAGVSNSNHGSSKIPSANSYKGVEGDTLTDGTGAALPIKQSEARITFPLGRRLPTGASIGWKITPPSGNTSATAIVVGHFFYDTSEG